jgi:PAS domain S-box-containing protein
VTEAGTPGGLSTTVESVAVLERRERRLATQYRVTTILAESPSFREAAPAILQAICDGLGWLVGIMWEVDAEQNVLSFVDAWHEASPEVEAFTATSSELTLSPGEGLPGRVLLAGEPVWIEDVLAEESFARADSAATASLHAAVGAPIVLGGETLGVMEFLGGEVRARDEDVLNVIGAAGSQIGQFVRRRRVESELRESRDELEAVLAGVREGILVEHRGGSIVFANHAAARVFGYPSVPALLGASVHEAFGRFEIEDEDGRPITRAKLPGRRALRGRYSPELLLKLRDRESGAERWVLAEATAIGDFEPPRLAVTVLRDITERRRRQEEQRFLAEASEILGSSLRHGETLQQIADLAVPRLADWCLVDTVQPDGTLVQVAAAHSDPSKLELARRFRKRHPSDPHQPFGAPQVARTGRSELYTVIPDELRSSPALGHLELAALRKLELRSALIVPMIARGRAIGTITLASGEAGRRYGSDDLALAEELARRAAVAVDNATLYEERSRIARTLQRSLLPPALPEMPFAELAARYESGGEGEVGGDFYDAFEVAGGAWAIVIGDVCGKGPEAASITALARHSVRTAALREPRPRLVLELLDEAILRQLAEETTFFTAVYAQLEPEPDGVRLVLARAGHPYPLVIRRSGEVERLGPRGGVLGAFGELDLEESELLLRPGDLLLLYTDGLLHALGAGDGDEALDSVAASCAGSSAEEAAARIEQAGRVTSVEPRDDLALLVVRISS